MKNLPINYDLPVGLVFYKKPYLFAKEANEEIERLAYQLGRVMGINNRLNARLEKLEYVYDAALAFIHEMSELDPVAVGLFCPRLCAAVRRATV